MQPEREFSVIVIGNSVIVIEFYVNLKKDFQNWIRPNIIFYMSTAEARMFAKACWLTGTSH